jgi:hypothetical protein
VDAARRPRGHLDRVGRSHRVRKRTLRRPKGQGPSRGRRTPRQEISSDIDIQYIAVHMQSFRESPVATTKTATITIRVDPVLKDALRAAALAEHRSIANMIEVLIREHCDRSGIAIDQSQESDQRGER